MVFWGNVETCPDEARLMIQMSQMISMRKFRFFPMRFPTKPPFGGFLFCHAGTPSSHPFFESDCPWNQPSNCGYPLFTDQFANWKITIFKLGKSTIFFGPFSNSYVKLPEGTPMYFGDDISMISPTKLPFIVHVIGKLQKKISLTFDRLQGNAQIIVARRLRAV